MAAVFQFILVIVCVLIFVVSRRYKLSLLILGAMCMQIFVIIPSMGITRGAMIIPLCFLMSELFKFRLSEFGSSIVPGLIAVMVVALIIAIVSSPHATESFASFLDVFLSGTVKGCFVLAFSYICVKSYNDIKTALNATFVALITLTIFAVLQIITGENVAVEMMQTFYTNVSERAMDINATELESGRYAIQSLCPFPAVYGYMCVIAMLFHYYGYKKQLFGKNKMVISLFCGGLGLFLCGRRSAFLCAVVALLTFLSIANGFKGRVKFFVIFATLFFAVYLIFPSIQGYVDLMLNLYEETGAEGSTIEMRTLQFTSVFGYIENDWLLGRGIGFFSKDLGGNMMGRESGLKGLEGAILSILLERGLIGVVAWIVYYLSMIVFAIKRKRNDNYTSAFVVSAILAYVVFSNGTGDLGSSYITLLMVGMGIKLLYLAEPKFSIKTNVINKYRAWTYQ